MCAEAPQKVLLGTRMADWIVVRVDDVREARSTALPDGTPPDSENSTVRSPKRELCLSLERASALSRKRGFSKSNKEWRLSTALNGQKIVFACTPVRKAQYSGILSCYTPFSREILRALRSYNATLVLKHLKDLDAAFNAVVHGHADILMAFSKQDEQVMEFLELFRPLQYAYETFYTVRNVRSAEVSFFAVLLDSRDGFCLLLAAMVVVWLTMSVRDFCFLGTFRLDAALDSGMFLIASFLANSTTVPAGSITSRGRSPRLSRMMILTAWMLAIFPLSVYFRGELTSRLAVTVPHDQMDTMDKLERALDRGAVQLCLVKDGCMNAVIAGTIPYRNDTLQAKLQKAFRLQRMRRDNSFNSMQGCLKCASKPGFACFSCGLEGCEAKRAMRTFVESREPFNMAYVTMPATKGYRLARAYDQLLQRMFETAMSPFNAKDERCDGDDASMWQVAHADYGEKITQVFELSAFFATFASLMCLSLFVLCVELTFGFFQA
ncbi:hypothetical protein HPB50_013015 [Hyalomma asiaticum]|uniref:Uncharacterized protein n=1 Tax=Hyalomma asiaticum TaxID=266040 RepID=A0ACB7T7Q9_HYAAI|nr:hypothetical protein HPB50_013015 [Hyalomma asiaticum]